MLLLIFHSAPMYKKDKAFSMTPTEAINTLYHDDLGVHQIDDWEFYTCAFDPFSTSFIKHAEKAIQDGRGKRHTENVRLRSRLIPFLLTCSICSCQTVSPHIFRTKSKLRLYTKKVQIRPPKIIVCWLSMVVSLDFLQTWSGTC